MIILKDKDTKEVKMSYTCTTEYCVELCMANIESLLLIALADSDEHIRELGGEKTLLELMNGYMDLKERLIEAEKKDRKE